MSYRLVYDVATSGGTVAQTWMFPAMGLLFTFIGAALVFAPGLMRTLLPGGLQGTARGCFSWFFFLFALVWTVVAGWAVVGQYAGNRSASAHNTCNQVAGVVSDFVPMPWTGHSMESFKVNGVSFEYSDYVISGGFNQTASHGGPIRDGLPVRICYVAHRYTTPENVIVRLEVADTVGSSTSAPE